MSSVLIINGRWDWQKLYWTSATQLILDCVTFVMIFIATTSIEFYVRSLLYIWSMEPIKLWLDLNHIRLIGIVISRWTLELIFLKTLSRSICFLTVHRPDSVHIWTILVSTFISRLSLEFYVWTYIGRFRQVYFWIEFV